MGMFDTLHFNCPDCGKQFEEQTKAGECLLRNFHQNSVPTLVAAQVVGDLICCPHCSVRFVIGTSLPERVQLTLTKSSQESLPGFD